MAARLSKKGLAPSTRKLRLMALRLIALLVLFLQSHHSSELERLQRSKTLIGRLVNHKCYDLNVTLLLIR